MATPSLNDLLKSATPQELEWLRTFLIALRQKPDATEQKTPGVIRSHNKSAFPTSQEIVHDLLTRGR